ncbi:hypothetical protein MPER_05336 [Moniliophthora perniciosa FA553]|nr:hypothetical protein MPER_05336 [Moniliophthora perniciosa FA553]
MCRFNSGFFFKHPLLQKYKWYWRIEPSVKFHCNIKDDPFLFMEKNDKVYGTVPVDQFAPYGATTCHFWSNFEIADMDFWRGEAYSAFSVT